MTDDPEGPVRAPTTQLTRLTTADSDAEAAMIVGALREAGIYAEGPNPNAAMRRGRGGGAIRVEAAELDRARTVLDSPAMSDVELIEAEEEDAAARSQLTRPEPTRTSPSTP